MAKTKIFFLLKFDGVNPAFISNIRTTSQNVYSPARINITIKRNKKQLLLIVQLKEYIFLNVKVKFITSVLN